MRALSTVYAAGLIAMIAISTSSFIIASMKTGADVQRARETALRLEAVRAMERLEARVGTHGLEVSNLGPSQARLSYIVYSDGKVERLERELGPGETATIPLSGEDPVIVTGSGNIIAPNGQASSTTSWVDAKLLKSKVPLIYDSGLLFLDGSYGPFAFPNADGQEYEGPIFACQERVYTLNLEDGELYLKAYTPLPLAKKQVIALPDYGEGGYVFDLGWGYVIATVERYNYASEFVYRILAWNGSGLAYKGEHRFSLPEAGTYPIAAFNGTHIVELKVARGSSSYRILEPHEWGLVVVEEGTFYIPSAGFPAEPYIEGYRQTATIAALAKGDRLVIASMDGNFRLYLTSVDMAAWASVGLRTSVFGYRSLPGLALLSEDRLLVFEQDSKAYLFDLAGMELLKELDWPFTAYEPVPGHWMGYGGSDIWSFAPPGNFVFYKEIYPAYFGLYLLENGSFAITTVAGAELFDSDLNPLGIVEAGGPVRQAHFCNEGWLFVVEGLNGVKIVAGG